MRESLDLKASRSDDRGCDSATGPLETLQGWNWMQGTPGRLPLAGEGLELGGSFVSGRGSLDFGVWGPMAPPTRSHLGLPLDPLELIQGWNWMQGTPGQHP